MRKEVQKTVSLTLNSGSTHFEMKKICVCGSRQLICVNLINSEELHCELSVYTTIKKTNINAAPILWFTMATSSKNKTNVCVHAAIVNIFPAEKSKKAAVGEEGKLRLNVVCSFNI